MNILIRNRKPVQTMKIEKLMILENQTVKNRKRNLSASEGSGNLENT